MRQWSDADQLQNAFSRGEGNYDCTFWNSSQYPPSVPPGRDEQGNLDCSGCPKHWMFTGDLNGDGKTDLISFTTTFTRELLSQATTDIITRIDNGLGGYSTITYMSSNDYPCHTTDTNGTCLYNKMPFALQVVSKIETYDGRNGPVIRKGFDYEGGYFDYGTRDFRGFNHVTAYQYRDASTYDYKTETWHHQDEVRKGRAYKVQTSSDQVGQKVVESTWTVRNLPSDATPLAKFPRLDRTDVTVTDTECTQPPGLTISAQCSYTHYTTYEYDSYLNLAAEHKYGGTTSTPAVHTQYTYSSSFPSRPESVIVRADSGGSPGNIVGAKWMDYDTSGNVLAESVCTSTSPATECASKTTAPKAVVQYTYATGGNPATVTGPGNDTYPQGCTTTMSYDATLTFATTTTNCLGHVTTTLYNPGTGKLTSTVPPHLQGTGLAAVNTYDAFGRVVQQSRPDGGITQYSYVDFGNPTTQYAEKREYIYQGSTLTHTHVTRGFFDGLGRTYLAQASHSVNGSDTIWSNVDTEYDSHGRAYRKSNPYFHNVYQTSLATGGPDIRLWTTTTFDNLSRPRDVQGPDGYTVHTDYLGLTQCAYDDMTGQNSHVTCSTKDINGKVVSVTDALGTTITYTYDVLGNLLTVTKPKPGTADSIVTAMTYDSMSKKITMNDPDMGYWTYSYDKSGNLTLQTDAKGQTTAFTYDQLNRVASKVTHPTQNTTETTTVYTYGASGSTLGMLVSTASTKGSETMTDTVLLVDVMQRITKSQKTIGASGSTVISKTYDTAGIATYSSLIIRGFPKRQSR